MTLFFIRLFDRSDPETSLRSLAYITHTAQSKKALQETALIERFG